QLKHVPLMLEKRLRYMLILTTGIYKNIRQWTIFKEEPTCQKTVSIVQGNYHETPDSRKYSGKAVTVEEYLITINNRIDDVLHTDKWETLKGTLKDAVNEK